MQANPLTMAQNALRYSSNTALARPPPSLVIHASTQNKWLPIQMHTIARRNVRGKQRARAHGTGRNGDLPGRERSSDHRRPKADVEAAGDAGRCALQDTRPGPRREREDGVHEQNGAGVPLIFGGYPVMAEAVSYLYLSSPRGRTEEERGSRAGEGVGPYSVCDNRLTSTKRDAKKKIK